MEQEIKAGDYRFMPSEISVDDGNTVSGLAIPYGKQSQPMPMNAGTNFVEIIESGAAGQAIRGDVKAYFNHGGPLRGEQPLGRTKSGTLQLSEEADGVHYRLTLPDTQLGRDMKTLLKRGDIQGTSFYLEPVKGMVGWTRNRDGMLLRSVRQMTNLKEISLVTDPVYLDTTATLRSFQDWLTEHNGEIPLSIRIRQARIARL